jgi:putative SOS response-associated peptidase YedK
MCGRYGLKLGTEDVAAALSELGMPVVGKLPDGFDPSRDLAPTDPTPVVEMAGDSAPLILRGARWGIVRVAPHARPTLVINARAETLRSRPLFRDGRRGLVPASGWFEWAPPEGTPHARRVPHWIHRPAAARGAEAQTDALLFFAALLFGHEDQRQVIITRPPEAAIAAIHDRMPAVVDADAARAWLSDDLTPETLTRLPVPGLAVALKSPRGPERPPQPRQLDLFGGG